MSSTHLPFWANIVQSLSITVGLIVMYARTKKDHPRILKKIQLLFSGTKKDDF